MYKLVFISFLFLASTLSTYAQWQKINQVSLPNIELSTLDVRGDLYTVVSNGDVFKYGVNGKLLLQYSPDRVGQIASIDASSGLKVVLFYAGLQEYVVLDRYLSKPIHYRLADYGVGYVSDLVLNRQNQLWVVDQTNFALTLIDDQRNEVLDTKSLAAMLGTEKADFVSMKFHQGSFYLVDSESNLMTFDNIGNYLMTKSIGKGQFRGINKDYVYSSHDGELYLTSLYRDENIALNLPHADYIDVIYDGDRLVLITSQGFEIYKYLSGN